MGIFYGNKSSNYSFTQGQVAIQQLRANPNSVPLCLENGNYYLASTDLERFMECSNTYDVDEAIEQVAEANNISSYEITMVSDGCSSAFMQSIQESAVVMEDAVEDDASNVRQANKFYKQLLKASKSKAESKKEIQERINALNDCVRQMEAEKKKIKSGLVTHGYVNYVLKDYIPFNSLWRLFKRNDKYAILGNLANIVVPFGSTFVRIGTYPNMLDDNIEATKEAIDFLKEKLKEMN